MKNLNVSEVSKKMYQILHIETAGSVMLAYLKIDAEIRMWM